METSQTKSPVGETDFDSVDSNQDSDDVQEKRKDGFVKHENYQRVLSEKRKTAEENQALKAKLREFEDEKKRLQDSELRKQNKYKELLEQKEKELADERSQSAKLKSEREYGIKLRSVLQKISGSVPSDYWQLIDVDSITIDPETGAVDDVSASDVAKEFQEKHGRLIDKPGSHPSDNKAPKPHGSGKLTHDEWLKLSPTDQRNRASEVEGMPSWMIQGGTATRKLTKM